MTKEQKERNENFLAFFEELAEEDHCVGVAGWLHIYIAQHSFYAMQLPDFENNCRWPVFDKFFSSIFGIKIKDQEKMFSAWPSTKYFPTKYVVVRMFLNYINTGKVDWAKAEEEEEDNEWLDAILKQVDKWPYNWL